MVLVAVAAVFIFVLNNNNNKKDDDMSYEPMNWNDVFKWKSKQSETNRGYKIKQLIIIVVVIVVKNDKQHEASWLQCLFGNLYVHISHCAQSLRTHFEHILFASYKLMSNQNTCHTKAHDRKWFHVQTHQTIFTEKESPHWRWSEEEPNTNINSVERRKKKMITYMQLQW